MEEELPVRGMQVVRLLLVSERLENQAEKLKGLLTIQARVRLGQSTNGKL